MKSTLFLTQTTVIDGAYIDSHGRLIGASFSPKFLVEGDVEKNEQVVIDFSQVKKRIKELIDHKETGVDHKTWLIDGVSNASTASVGTETVVATPAMSLTVPPDALRSLPNPARSHDIGKILEGALTSYLTHTLRQTYPSVTVKCFISTDIGSMEAKSRDGRLGRALFRYTHGLRNSSSWGCQNIAHGHLSYIELLTVTEDGFVGTHQGNGLALRIAHDLHDTIFVDKANIKQRHGNRIIFGYTSSSRGPMEAQVDVTEQKVEVLPTETTIENLIEYVKDRYALELKAVGADYLAISEGLVKGSMVALGNL